MKIPKEIAEKVRIYQEHSEIANAAYKEAGKWLIENTEADGVCIDDIFIAKKPTGKYQGEGEWCDQHSVGWCEDSYAGKYYHEIEDSDEYLGYSYEC